MTKKSKHPRYDDPSAFKQQFPRIVEVKDGSLTSPLAGVQTVKYYSMGKCKVMLHEADEQMGWFMSVRREDRYPSWDEIVWLRYKLIPDSVRMGMILPNLNAYINQEDTIYKNVFTMEQTGWTLDPVPTHCGKRMGMDGATQTNTVAVFTCSVCGERLAVEFDTWNEQHGNGCRVEEKP